VNKKLKNAAATNAPGDRAPANRWPPPAVAAAVGAALLALAALGLAVARGDAVAARAAAGWGETYGAIIVRRQLVALWHGAGLLALGALALFGAARLGATGRRRLLWGLALVVTLDALALARHYIVTLPAAALAENDVIRLLKKDMPHQRVAVAQPDGFYNTWLTYLFPYHEIKTVNITQMPRMPEDYRRFLTALGNQPLRFWPLAAVGPVLAPARLWDAWRRDPALARNFDLLLAYNAAPDDSGLAVRVLPAAPGAPAGHVVLRFKNPAPRFALLAGWRELSDDAALAELARPDAPMLEQALAAPDPVASWPALNGTGQVGQVVVRDYRMGRVVLKTQSDAPAVLRAADRYDPDWRATLDGRPAPIRRVDFLFQGVFVPAGEHEIALEYAPPRGSLRVQAAGFALFGIGLLGVAWSSLRRRPATESAAA